MISLVNAAHMVSTKWTKVVPSHSALSPHYARYSVADTGPAVCKYTSAIMLFEIIAVPSTMPKL